MANVIEGNLPPELFAEQQRLARRQQIADMLTKQGMTPVTSSNPRSPVSWTQGLAQMYSAYRGGSEANAVAEDQSKLYGKYQNLLADEVRRYMDSGQARTIAPDPQEVAQSQDQGTDAPQPVTIAAKDARSRITEAMLSQNPMVRALGAKDYEALIKQSPNAMLGKIDPKDYTTESFTQFMATGNAALLKPARKKEAGPDGVYRDPYEVATGTVAPDPNKPFSAGPDGKPVPNKEFQAYDLDRREKGAPRVTVNTSENPFLRGLGAEAAKQFETSANQARGAVDTIDTVHQIRNALDTSNIQLGPGTKFKQFIGRVGEKFVGATAAEQEKMAKGKEIVQGLAKLELDGAQQMKGQGPITDAERDIVRRAASGDIDSMSNSEVRSLMNALEKAGRAKIKAHAAKVESLKKSNKASGLVMEQFEVPMPGEYVLPAQPGVPVISPRTKSLLDQFAPEPTP